MCNSHSREYLSTPSPGSKQVVKTSSRIESLDVTRAIALFGVVAMNYHAYLNGERSMHPAHPSVWERLFNPLSGPLTTRFAATFVMIAGIGVSLFTERARTSGNRSEIRQARLVLLRRGILLYLTGYFVQWIWPGTILFYYGAYFIIAAAIFGLSCKRLIGIGIASMAIAAGLSWWRADQFVHNNPTLWLSPSPNSPRNLVIRTFLDYTHPVFPWIAFFIGGIILGRYIHQFAEIRMRLIFVSIGVMLITHSCNYFFTPTSQTTNSNYIFAKLMSTQPLDRGLLFSLGTLATTFAMFGLISIAVESAPKIALTQFCARAGRMTLSAYLLHVLFFNLVVHQMHWVGPSGLDTALLLSLSFYVVALIFASEWNKRFGTGPAERIYRAFGG